MKEYVTICVMAMIYAGGVSASAASFQGLGDLPGDSFGSRAYGISANGSVVVGRGISDLGCEAFRWTQSGFLPPHRYKCH